MMSRRILLAGLMLLVSAVLMGAKTVEPSSSEPKGTVCWPLNFAGVTLGVTTDAQVRRLLGKGVHRSEEGDTGGRYFIDSKRRATLHVLGYTDMVVGELSVTDGIDPTLNEAEQSAAESPYFDPRESFGNWHAIHLGSSKADVLKNLGDPARKENSDSWEYLTSCTCEIPQSFILRFRKGVLFQIVFSAPAG